jgi:hypothetical protein
MNMENDIDREKLKNSRKTCPGDTLFITNPTSSDPGAKSDLCGERYAANRLSHGTAILTMSKFVYRLSHPTPINETHLSTFGIHTLGHDTGVG